MTFSSTESLFHTSPSLESIMLILSYNCNHHLLSGTNSLFCSSSATSTTSSSPSGTNSCHYCSIATMVAAFTPLCNVLSIAPSLQQPNRRVNQAPTSPTYNQSGSDSSSGRGLIGIRGKFKCDIEWHRFCTDFLYYRNQYIILKNNTKPNLFADNGICIHSHQKCTDVRTVTPCYWKSVVKALITSIFPIHTLRSHGVSR